MSGLDLVDSGLASSLHTAKSHLSTRLEHTPHNKHTRTDHTASHHLV